MSWRTSSRLRQVQNIDYSCPSIDEIEDLLKEATRLLEDVRKVNSSLRDCATEFAEEADDLENQLADAEEEARSLRRDLEDAQCELDRLEALSHV
jgi:predicted  nucleic acid-binding Zn-ribbon protein